VRRRLLVGLAVLTAAFALFPASPAAADTLAIRAVDTSKFPQVTARILVSGQAPDAATFNIIEDGIYVQPTKTVAVPRADLPLGIAVVVDTSASMAQLDKIGQTKAMLRRMIAAKAPGDQMAIIGFGTTARVLSDLTADDAPLERAVSLLGPAGDSALYDGVRLGAGVLATHASLRPNLIVVADGRDKGSTGKFDDARSTALSSRAQIFALSLPGAPDFDPGDLKSLASATGGAYVETTDPVAIPDIGARIQRNLASEYELTYSSEAKTSFELTVSVGTMQAKTGRITPDVLRAKAATFTEEKPAASIGPLRTRFGALVVAVLWFIALAGIALAGLQLLVPNKGTLDNTLVGYTLDPAEMPVESDGSVVTTPFVRRLVAFTERMGQSRGFVTSMENRLEQADLKLRAGEVALFTVVAAVLIGVIVTLMSNPFFGLLFGLMSLLLPVFVLNTMAKLRRRRFTSQLPDMLNLLAAVLRSGYAILQGLDAVSKEVGEPMGGELRRVLAEARLGRDVNDALRECSERMQSPDFDWAVLAIGIQREVGGNLAELLSTVADTMVQRERLRREVKGLTAEGRMSAYVLGLLTPGVGLVMYTLNPEYVQILFSELTGQILLGGSTILAVFGFWWMNKIIQVDV
jgi:tight adherence protein B